jgi:hypothetical protein
MVDDSTRVSAQNFTWLGGRSDFLCPFIWSCVSGLMQFRGGHNKGTATMPPACPGLSPVMRTEFMVMILRQSNNPPNGKV